MILRLDGLVPHLDHVRIAITRIVEFWADALTLKVGEAPNSSVSKMVIRDHPLVHDLLILPPLPVHIPNAYP